MCMKVRVTDDYLQESCKELQSTAECLSISEKNMRLSGMGKQSHSEETQQVTRDNTSSSEKEKRQEGESILDEEMENVIRTIVQSNRIHIAVQLFFSLFSSPHSSRHYVLLST